VHVIYQDVHARILTKNLVCWLTGIAQTRLDQAADTDHHTTTASDATPTTSRRTL